jgi:hypothetical protein
MDTLPSTAANSNPSSCLVSPTIPMPYFLQVRFVHNLYLQLQQEHPLVSADACGTNMWAERNLHKAMQPVRPQMKPTDAQKNTQKIAAAWNKESSVLLAADVLILTVVRNTQIEELATKHNVTKQHVKKLINNFTHYKKPHVPNLANALVHMKENELNEGI